MPEGPDWDAIAAEGLLDVDAASVVDRRTLIEFLLDQGCTLEPREVRGISMPIITCLVRGAGPTTA